MIQAINFPEIFFKQESKSSKKVSLEEAAEALESLFLYELLKRMDETVIESDLFGPPRQEKEIFKEFYFQILSDQVAHQSPLGLKKLLIETYKSHA